MNDLQDRIALVTGSSRGIGAAIAKVFAKQGAAVIVHGRDAGAVAAVTAQIDETGVAHAALFLASDHSSWISGITLDVAGGSVLV